VSEHVCSPWVKTVDAYSPNPPQTTLEDEDENEAAGAAMLKIRLDQVSEPD
jgi:hypothetical protein